MITLWLAVIAILVNNAWIWVRISGSSVSQRTQIEINRALAEMLDNVDKRLTVLEAVACNGKHEAKETIVDDPVLETGVEWDEETRRYMAMLARNAKSK